MKKKMYSSVAVLSRLVIFKTVELCIKTKKQAEHANCHRRMKLARIYYNTLFIDLCECTFTRIIMEISCILLRPRIYPYSCTGKLTNKQTQHMKNSNNNNKNIMRKSINADAKRIPNENPLKNYSG